jgi:hypothetical protein
MKLFKNKIIRLFIALSFSFLVFSPNITFAVSFFADDSDVIWSSGDSQYLKYAEQDKSNQGNNDHPVELEAKDITNALQGVEYTIKTLLESDSLENLFSRHQANLLGKELAKGLKNAQPNQDILFALGGSTKKLLLLTRKTFTAGRAFYKEGKLNIIFGEYNKERNEAVEKAVNNSGTDGVAFSYNHGFRTKRSNKFKGDLEEATGVENKSFGKSVRTDWFVIDVEVAAKAYIAKINERQNPSAKRDASFEIEAAKLAKERRQMRAEMARMRKDMQDADTGTASKKSLEERINTLDELRKGELITQEEYDMKRKEILNDI